MTICNKHTKYKFIALSKQIILLLAVFVKPPLQNKYSSKTTSRSFDFIIGKYFSVYKVIFPLWKRNLQFVDEGKKP